MVVGRRARSFYFYLFNIGGQIVIGFVIRLDPITNRHEMVVDFWRGYLFIFYYSAKTQQPSPPSNKFKSSNKSHTNLEKGDNFSHKRDRHYDGEQRSHPQSSSAIQQRSSSQTMVKYNSEVFNFNRERDMPRGREAPGPSVSKYNSQ